MDAATILFVKECFETFEKAIKDSSRLIPSTSEGATAAKQAMVLIAEVCDTVVEKCEQELKVLK